MKITSAFRILRISSTCDESAIKHAYAQLSKSMHPEEDPEGWSRLFEAYQTAMEYAKSRHTGNSGTVNRAVDDGIWKAFEQTILETKVKKENGSTTADDVADLSDDLVSLFQEIDEIEEGNRELIEQMREQIRVLLGVVDADYVKKPSKVVSIYSFTRIKSVNQLLALVDQVGLEYLPENMDESVVRALTADLSQLKQAQNKATWKPPWWYKLILRRRTKDLMQELRLVDRTELADRIKEYCRIHYRMSKKGTKAWLLWATVGLVIMTIATFHYRDEYQIPKTIHYQPYTPDSEEGSYVKFELASIDNVVDTTSMDSETVRVGKQKQVLITHYFLRFIECTSVSGEPVTIMYKQANTAYGFSIHVDVPEAAVMVEKKLQKILENADRDGATVYGIMRKGKFGYLDQGVALTAIPELYDLHDQDTIEEWHEALEKISAYSTSRNYMVISDSLPEDGSTVYEDAYRYVVKPMRIPIWVIFLLLELFPLTALLGWNPLLTVEKYY